MWTEMVTNPCRNRMTTPARLQRSSDPVRKLLFRDIFCFSMLALATLLTFQGLLKLVFE